MSPQEVVHRTREQFKRLAWKSYSRGWERFEISDGELPAIAGLRSSLSNARSRQELCQQELCQRIRDAAQGIAGGPLEIFGRPWSHAPLARALAGDPLIFHFDPVSKRHWPAKTYCFDIPFRETEGYGDYKFCAELNTLQICQTLAAAARMDENRELERLTWSVWDAWYAANPPFLGISWVSGVNIALRVVSLLMTASMLDAPPEETRRHMRALLNASAYWLERYPSLHSSANNHLMAESVALFVLGTLCPDLPGAVRYARIGRERIEQHASRLILPDGAGAEMSPSYAAFAIEWILLAAVVAKGAGQPLGTETIGRLAAAARHFKWLQDDDGKVPSIGDNDNSCVIASAGEEPRYVASITAAIAGVTELPELSPVAYDPALRDLIFLAPKAAVPEGDGIRHFNAGGLSVVRETRRSGRSVLVFDHGPLGHSQIGAHGHADALAIWLSVGGQPVFIDAGTYLYNGGGAWRDYFRSTAVHNTVEVAGQSSSIMSGAFNWSQHAQARLTGADDKIWTMEAEHDGYRERLGRKHIRRLTRTGAGFRVDDRLEGGAAPVRIGFLIHPDLSAVVEGRTVHVTRDGGPVVSLTSLSGWAPQIIRGADRPPGGWVSLCFGVKAPAEQIVFSGEMSAAPVATDIVIHG
jgi:hypothetical protein